MVNFDGRKQSQYFQFKGKNIYCWKQKNGSYHIGMNGTSQHFRANSKEEAKSIIENTDWKP